MTVCARRPGAAIALVFVLAVAGVGCSGNATESKYIPGKADAPEVCTKLASSEEIRDLSAPLTRLIAGEPSDPDREQIRGAADALGELSVQPDLSATLAAQLKTTGAAVHDLVQEPAPSEQQIALTTSNLQKLDEDVQAVCEFPASG